MYVVVADKRNRNWPNKRRPRVRKMDGGRGSGNLAQPSRRALRVKVDHFLPSRCSFFVLETSLA